MDFGMEELGGLLEKAGKIKAEWKAGAINNELGGRTLIMLFEKTSTRTRLSFEAGMTQLGGHAIYADFKSSQLKKGETLADTARVMSRYGQGIMARLYRHADILEIARNSSVPVINGLTDLEHPCQAMADLLTMKENGKLAKGRKFAFIGDCGFNMANSLMLACAKFGMEVALVCPESCRPNPDFVREASKFSKVGIYHDIGVGVEGADVVYTDVWVSMGQEGEAEARLGEYAPYQVNSALLSRAKGDCIVMHCLPANRGQEITNEVIDGKRSVVWDQAENRLHFQKALMLELMKKA